MARPTSVRAVNTADTRHLKSLVQTQHAQVEQVVVQDTQRQAIIDSVGLAKGKPPHVSRVDTDAGCSQLPVVRTQPSVRARSCRARPDGLQVNAEVREHNAPQEPYVPLEFNGRPLTS